jgi:hypothetical protein
MNNEKLRGLLDLAGASAVLIGLVFVGLELRQNTAAVEAASLQNLTDASSEYLLMLASDVELARIWLDASRDRSQLSEIDTTRYFFLTRARWLRMQNAYLQWRRGTLSDEDWSIYSDLICVTGTDGALGRTATWEEHRFVLIENFVEFVENCWSNSQ